MGPMKNILLTFVVVLISALAFSQQLPQYTQFFLNKALLNPGATGVENYWEGQVTNRLQWVGIQDAPRTHILSANGPLRNANMGLGGKIFADIVGPTRRSGFSFSYGYKLKISETLKLGMGLSFGGLQYITDASQITIENPGDVALSNSAQSLFLPDAGVGFHLYSEEFYVGISMPQLLGNKLQFFENYQSTEAALARHLFAYAGYKFSVTDDIVIEPAVMAKYVQPAPISLDANLRVIYKDMAWAGFSYRMNDAIAVMAGFTINESLVFGYSYDIPTSDIQTVTSGSHEIMLGIRFKEVEKKP
jgi:type IX secretion system PorP/SprF family membrane protein